MRDLLEIREDIDVIDAQMLELFKKRMLCAQDVAEYKIANNKPVLDKIREEQKLEKLTSDAEDEFTRQGIRELFSLIMSVSRKKQYRMLAELESASSEFSEVEELDIDNARIIYQGVEGAYSQAACMAYFGQCAKDAEHVATWREAMEMISDGRADYAVLPIENSTEGAIIENLDLLAEFDVAIVGEQIISVNHALLGTPDSDLSSVRMVYSHPQAILQSDRFLRDHAEYRAEAVLNTAVAAKLVSDSKDPTKAAIAGEINADIYGLKILASCIQDEKNNKTRFIIVSKNRVYMKKADKISIMIELPHRSGSLYQILSHFIFNGLNMTKIESRPVKDRDWEYRFYIDFEGNLNEDGVKNALKGLKEETNSLKILGNYRQG